MIPYLFAIIAACSAPVEVPPANVLTTIRFEYTGGFMSDLDPHELVAYDKWLESNRSEFARFIFFNY